MKHISGILLILLMACLPSQAQTGRGKLVGAELYFDTDPGAGNGIALTFNPGLDSSFQTALHNYSSALTTGLHTVNVRFKDSLDQWGEVFKTTLVIENALPSRSISASVARAFWDSNIASAQMLMVYNGNASDAINTFINSSSLPSFSTPGLHKLSVQVLGANGQFSPAFSTTVNVEEILSNNRTISAALGRVYWDNNPGLSTGLVIFNGNAGNAFNEFINASTIPSFSSSGLHKLNVQMLDPEGSGNYGPLFSTAVLFEEELINTQSKKVTEARFWLDNDVPPAIGNMLAIDGNFDSVFESALQSQNLPIAGLHILHVQVRDSANGWGPVFNSAISVENPLSYRNIQISTAQLYWDNDSSSAILLIAVDGNYSDAIEMALSAGINVPSAGLHTLNVRCRDVAGNWSNVFKTSIVIETPLTARSVRVVVGEIRIDNNPPAMVIGLNGNFNKALEEMQSVLLSGSLLQGLHTINVRIKGADNNWGNYFTTTLLVSPCSSTPMPVVSVSGPLSFCSGDSVVLTANAGFNSYTWLRDNIIVGNNSSISASVTGEYTVVVTDTTNCPNAALPVNVIVHDPEVLITSPNVYCQGTTDSLVATPGFESYAWSAGSASEIQYISGGGLFTVTITDAFGCIDSASILINELLPPDAPLITSSGPLSFCPGDSVTLTSSVTGNIIWNNGLTVASFTTDTTGYYSVTVTGNNGCTSSTAVNAERYNPAQASIQLNGTAVYCLNSPSSLSANESVSYTWSNGATTQAIQALVSGNYTVAVIDTHGCTAVSAPFSVTVNPNPAVPVITANGPLSFCNGGSVTLSSTSGLQHLWSNGSTTSSVTVTQSLTLTDTVINQYGCMAWSAPVSVDVHPSASITASGPTSFCDGDSVILTALPATGVRYDWHNGATTGEITLSSSASAYVIVTETLTGCSDTAYVNVVMNALPSGSISAAGPTLVCPGEGLTMNASGTPHSRFQWFKNGVPLTYSLYSSGCSCYISYNVYGYSYTASSAGVYSALAIDTLTGCTQFTNDITFSIQVPDVPVISANGGTTLCINENTLLTSSAAVSYLWNNGSTSQSVIASVAGYYTVTTTDNLGCTAVSLPTLITFHPTAVISASGSTVLCAGDSVSLSASPAGTYLWSNGATNASVNGINAPGNYTVLVTDINGCTSVSDPVQIVVNALPTGSISAAGSTTICSGSGLTLNTSGSPHTIYKWYLNATPLYYYNSTVQVSGYSFYASTQGQYSALVYDTLTGCSSFTNAIAVFVNDLPTIQINQVAPVLCYGGNEASLEASGSGTPGPYNYAWSNGASGFMISSLTAGLYIATVTDMNGCTKADTFLVSQPSELAPAVISPVFAGGFNISCAGGNNGSVSVSAGGTAPYSYAWSTGGTSSSLTNLVAGSYTVTVTDANGCSDADDIILTQPTVFSVQLSPSLFSGGYNISCFNGSNGSLSTVTSGGTGAAAWLWSTGAVTGTINGLSAGTYSVSVTDSTGCIAFASLNLMEPPELTVSSSPSQFDAYNVSCYGSNDGSIGLTVSGGVPGYHFLWSDSVTVMNRMGLTAGTYFVEVYDTNLCITVDTIMLVEPDSIFIVTAGSTLNCYGDANGTASAIAGGGNGPYNYLWSNGAPDANTTGLSAGIYQVTVTDSRGCTRVQTAQVMQPQELIGYAFGTYTDCGSQIGLLSVTASGGTSPYTFLWSNGSTSAFQTNIPPGNYSVTVTDAHGCIDTAFAIILNPPDLSATAMNYAVQCENSTNGILSVMASGGVSPYSYLWSNGSNTATITNLGTGNYTVIVTDANGCTAIATPSVNAITEIDNQFTPVISCTGGPNTISTVSSGGMAPYTYLWNTGAVTSIISGVTNGSYTVTVTDANGCVITDTTQFQGYTVFANGPTTLCVGDSVTLSAAGGSNYLWSNGATTSSVTVYNSGNYTVSIDGCYAGNDIVVLATYCEQTIDLKVFFEGFYNPVNDSLIAVLDPLNQPLICDSVTVLLRDSADLQWTATVNGIINTGGSGSYYFPSLLPGRQYYIVVKHRNSLETWSKYPFLFLSPATYFDFTSP